jgi:chloramphenicol-sensitive protein RarD
VESVVGLGAETLLLTPLAAAFVGYTELRGQGAIGVLPARGLALLMCSGVLTAMPLWLFSFGARRVTLASVGLLGYLSPTMQLLLGVFVFHETWDSARAWGFGLIWAGLALYSADALRARYTAYR